MRVCFVPAWTLPTLPAAEPARIQTSRQLAAVSHPKCSFFNEAASQNSSETASQKKWSTISMICLEIKKNDHSRIPLPGLSASSWFFARHSCHQRKNKQPQNLHRGCVWPKYKAQNFFQTSSVLCTSSFRDSTSFLRSDGNAQVWQKKHGKIVNSLSSNCWKPLYTNVVA